MAPPVLNVRLALEHPDREGDGLGGYRIEWRHLGWLWAAMAARSGVQRQAEVSAETIRVMVLFSAVCSTISGHR
mgnify:CR=1 FL=1